MAEEFTEFLARLWGENENVTAVGQYWRMADAFRGVAPRYGRPVMVTATSSPAGIDYAERQARAYREAILAGLDEGVMSAISKERSNAHTFRGHDPRLRALGGNIHVVSSPDMVVDTSARLKEGGIDGVQLGFFDVAPDLDHFGEQVLPLI